MEMHVVLVLRLVNINSKELLGCYLSKDVNRFKSHGVRFKGIDLKIENTLSYALMEILLDTLRIIFISALTALRFGPYSNILLKVGPHSSPLISDG
ncbi:hypothetical protein NPIL_354391 [Nephila pilipes]|uniref:Uncharacterized protein n=1 Tax=Nephila pilipes TaxID=299642 RepID=A0A8X6NJT0_NEPPI|nr:hypothetical protein NPIL_354391 [Nephila pilipes]